MEKKEAIKILKDFHDKSALFSVRTALETLYPELKESEDEKVREAIICGMTVLKDQGKETFATVPINDCIVWLEKQGKKSQRMISAKAKEALYDKPAAWSEEEEVKINRIVACLENLKVADNDILLKDVDWLKSLKQRIGGKL